MKTAISALAFAAALGAGAAHAADLPSQKGPPPAYVPPPPVMSWNGFYVGVNVGGGFQDATSSNVLWGSGGGAAGIVGGGQIGYNWQVTPMFVLGAEADFQGSSIGNNAGNNWNWWGGPDTARINWFGTVRGRLGVTLFSPNVLVYGSGGFAYGEVQRNWWDGNWWNSNSA
ncbi:MAG: porin family protein, partial [Methylocystis sp.]|nr:porin family protein [Methylocystis sp.]